tara:strand:- start:119 stop:505 length:387 start_codon:yes stop_codon:yes gene_type:complete
MGMVDTPERPQDFCHFDSICEKYYEAKQAKALADQEFKDATARVDALLEANEEIRNSANFSVARVLSQSYKWDKQMLTNIAHLHTSPLIELSPSVNKKTFDDADVDDQLALMPALEIKPTNKISITRI